MNSPESCIFCKIVNKQAPASILYESDVIMAFLDIRPINLGHTLVIPKAHYVDIFDIPERDFEEVYTFAKQISSAIKKATHADGISIIQQNNKAAGQDIFHFHVHVVPRFREQNLPNFSDLKLIERAKLEEMANKIRKQI